MFRWFTPSPWWFVGLTLSSQELVATASSAVNAVVFSALGDRGKAATGLWQFKTIS